MTSLSKEILDRWQVRKTKEQKSEFIRFMKEKFPEMKVEESGRIKSRNLVIGDVGLPYERTGIPVGDIRFGNFESAVGHDLVFNHILDLLHAGRTAELLA